MRGMNDKHQRTHHAYKLPHILPTHPAFTHAHKRTVVLALRLPWASQDLAPLRNGPVALAVPLRLDGLEASREQAEPFSGPLSPLGSSGNKRLGARHCHALVPTPPDRAPSTLLLPTAHSVPIELVLLLLLRNAIPRKRGGRNRIPDGIGVGGGSGCESRRLPRRPHGSQFGA